MKRVKGDCIRVLGESGEAT